jgi:hypothetical protein
MPTIFKQLEQAALDIQNILAQYEAVDEGHVFSWPNFVYKSPVFRRAHLDIVDAREEKKLYMMHLCIFPHVNDPSPIFGFDIIAGPNKVTGAFHDFSPVETTHPMLAWFADAVAPYTWSKERVLPEWAKNIFSGNMVAAGNISDEQELATILRLVMANLTQYLALVGHAEDRDCTAQQNWYCHNQKQNPHTPRVMTALGLDTDEVHHFIHACLFPEISGSAS